MKKKPCIKDWRRKIDHDNEILLRWLHLPEEEQDEYIKIRKLVRKELTNYKRKIQKTQLDLYDEIRPKYPNKFQINEELVEFAISEAISDVSKRR